MNNRCVKLFSVLTIIVTIGYSNNVLSQEMRVSLCKEFLNSKEIYVINETQNTQIFNLSNDSTFTFEKLVRKNWPEKKVVLIDKKEYNKSNDVKSKFHLTISSYSTGSSSNNWQGSMDMIMVKKGKFGGLLLKRQNILYGINIDFDGIRDNILTERLIFAVQSMKEILNNYNDESVRSRFIYKKESYQNDLKTDTLYLVKNTLNHALKNSEAITQIYPYNFKFVSDNELTQAIQERRENVLFIEIINSGDISGIDIYSVKEGRMIIGTMGWLNYLTLDKQFFQKAFM